jgi:hypothetical protein
MQKKGDWKMNLILSPRSTTMKRVLEDVAYFTTEDHTLLVVFKDGRTRNYPLIHLWYYESEVV